MRVQLPLEDKTVDVIDKALCGCGCCEKDVPKEEPDRSLFLHRKLRLCCDALKNLDHYHPEVNLPKSIEQFSFPLYESGVNVWVIHTKEGIVVVDTSTDPDRFSMILDRLSLNSMSPPLAILLTHHHSDHEGGLEACPGVPVIDAFHPCLKNVKDGDCGEQTIGSTTWQIYRMPGHSDDSVVFATHIDGHLCLFTGDTLFAGSMGKVPQKYWHAHLDRLHHLLGECSPDTYICPGHGPATSVALEWKHNPFLHL